jgi:tetratricopeptide (TPR) repeat protein
LKEGAQAGLYLGALFCYGVAVGELGQYQKAMDTLSQGRAFGLEIGDHITTPKVMNTLGWGFHELCQYERAIRANQESLEHLRTLDHSGNSSIYEAECQAEVNLGEDYLALGNYEIARQWLEDVRKHSKQPEYHWARFRWKARCLLTLGELALAQGDTLKAQADLDEVRADGWLDGFPIKKYQVRAARLQGNIHAALGKATDAVQELGLALERAEALGFPTPLWQTLRSLGDLYRSQGMSAEARSHFGKAREIVQGIADSLTDEELKRGFLTSSTTRDLFSLAEPE